jgi:hypothetical protein
MLRRWLPSLDLSLDEVPPGNNAFDPDRTVKRHLWFHEFAMGNVPRFQLEKQ